MKKKFYTRENIDQYIFERVIVSYNNGKKVKGLMLGFHRVSNAPQYDAIIIEGASIPLNSITDIEIDS